MRAMETTFILVRVLYVGYIGNVGVSRFSARVLNVGYFGHVAFSREKMCLTRNLPILAKSLFLCLFSILAEVSCGACKKTPLPFDVISTKWSVAERVEKSPRR